MNITLTQEQGRVPITVIKPEGRINLGNADELFQKAQAAYDEGMRDLIVDLGEVESISSAGLRSILSIAKILNGDRAQLSGAKGDTASGKVVHFKIANPQPQVETVLDIAGFYQLIEIYDNLKDAIDSSVEVGIQSKPGTTWPGGLVRVMNKCQEFLWVHERFAGEY